MTTCLGIRSATHWADARSIERISCLYSYYCCCCCSFWLLLGLMYLVLLGELWAHYL